MGNRYGTSDTARYIPFFVARWTKVIYRFRHVPLFTDGGARLGETHGCIREHNGSLGVIRGEDNAQVFPRDGQNPPCKTQGALASC